MHNIDRVTDSIFKHTPDVRGIFTTNALVYKVVQYLKGDQQQKKKIALIGYDLTSKNIPCLRQGKVDFLISQKPEIQSYRGIYTLYRHVALREPIEPTMMMPLDIVTKENLDFYLEM
jgi:LacI family transcriptional regulator